MPQLQVVNTGGNFMNTALGNISQGFIESFNKRQETARNDEIFSRIKSKYGPSADPDVIYKDILQSSGFDQSYKKNLLGQIKDLGVLKRDKEKTLYDSIRQQQYEVDLGIKKQNAATGELNAKNRAKELDLSEQRLNLAKSKGDRDLPKAFSDYSNQALKNVPYTPDEKAFIDSTGVKLIKQNKDNADYTNADALAEALQLNTIRKDIMEKTVAPPPAEDGYFSNATAQDKEKSVDALFNYLKSAYDAGVTSQKDLLDLAKKGKWNAQDANKVIQKVMQKQKPLLSTPSQEQVNALF